jgi:GT2 family glycosyltransferase
MPAASVIVPTYNRPAALVATLDALCAMDSPDELEILVVDTGAPVSSVEGVVVSRGLGYVRHGDEGVAAARNRGAALATGELLMFVDDDIVVGKDNLLRHQAIHRQDHRCFVSGHWEFDPSLRETLQTTPLGRYRLRYEDLYNKPHGVDVANPSGRVHPLTLAAGNLSVPRGVFWSLGGFDDRFPVGAEDQDLTWRARKAGCTLVYDYGIRVIHNDQHRDLVALCKRQERGAVGLVYFSRKHPDYPAPSALLLNGPLRPTDSPRLMLRKIVRGALSRPLPLALIRYVVRGTERVRPEGGWPLPALYQVMTGLYVFRGVRRGFRLTAGTTWRAGHDAGVT